MRELPSLRTITKIWAINHINIKKHIALIKESTQNGRFDVEKFIVLLEKSVQNNELDGANLWTDKESNLLQLPLLDELNLWENKYGNLLPLYDACRLPAEEAERAEIEALVHYHITQLPEKIKTLHLNMAFLFSVRYGQINTVKKLLKLGANMQAIFNYTSDDTVDDLTRYNNIQRYPFPGAKDKKYVMSPLPDTFKTKLYGDIAVKHAAERNYVNIVALLLKEGEGKDTVLTLPYLIYITIQNDALDTLNYLLNEKNRLNKQLTQEELTTLKQEAIKNAAQSGKTRILLALVDQLSPKDVIAVSPHYYSAMLKAIANNQIDIFTQLLKYKTNHPEHPVITTGDLGNLLIHAARGLDNNAEKIKPFFNNSRDLTAQAINKALEESVFFCNLKSVTTLINHGARASFPTIKAAAKRGLTKITHLFLLTGAAPTLDEKKILLEKTKKRQWPETAALLEKWIKHQEADEQQAAERKSLIPSNMMRLFATTNTSDQTTSNTPKSDHEEELQTQNGL